MSGQEKPPAAGAGTRPERIRARAWLRGFLPGGRDLALVRRPCGQSAHAAGLRAGEADPVRAAGGLGLRGRAPPRSAGGAGAIRGRGDRCRPPRAGRTARRRQPPSRRPPGDREPGSFRACSSARRLRRSSCCSTSRSCGERRCSARGRRRSARRSGSWASRRPRDTSRSRCSTRSPTRGSRSTTGGGSCSAGLRRRFPERAAIALSSLAFTAHHVIVLAFYFRGAWWMTLLASTAVFVGGAAWSRIYGRSGSLAGPWLSHLLVDAALMSVGYDMLWPVS